MSRIEHSCRGCKSNNILCARDGEAMWSTPVKFILHYKCYDCDLGWLGEVLDAPPKVIDDEYEQLIQDKADIYCGRILDAFDVKRTPLNKAVIRDYLVDFVCRMSRECPVK